MNVLLQKRVQRKYSKVQLGEEESSSKGRLGGWWESKASLEGFSPSLSFFLELLYFLPFRPKRAYKSPKNIEDFPRDVSLLSRNRILKSFVHCFSFSPLTHSSEKLRYPSLVRWWENREEQNRLLLAKQRKKNLESMSQKRGGGCNDCMTLLLDDLSASLLPPWLALRSANYTTPFRLC